MSEADGAGHRDGGDIIIVRRRADHEEEEHGGVWKIAFADFMTALMAFFLVMWLTNSASDSTREQVAKYFNPIKLTDPAPSERGLKDTTVGGKRSSEDTGAGEVEVEADSSGKPVGGEKTGGEDTALFSDPYAVLADIAAEGPSTKGEGPGGRPDGSGDPGLNGGDAYRDPFDPQAWQLEPNTSAAASDAAGAAPAEFETAVQRTGPAASQPESGAEKASEGSGAQADGGAPGEVAALPSGAGAPDETAGDENGQAEQAEEEVQAVREAIERSLAEDGRTMPENLDVEAGDGGLTISLAEDVDGGMFEIGSAKPTPAAVAMMERIAGVLEEKEGSIILRGHTDSRPFSDGASDNWQLSSSRAQMAFYMLSRGGLDAERVQAIEGVADRDPKLPDQPEAAANRRIEILLKRPQS